MISKHIFTSDVVSGKAFWLNNLQSTGNLVTANSNFTITNDATILGDLTVKGSTTTIDTVTLTVDDHNIELGSVDNPTDSTADGGGITLKGSSDKTFNWSSASNAWESNVGLNVLGGNVGIGTTSPDYKLHVNGGGYFAGEAIPNTAPANGVYLGESAGGPDYHVSIISPSSKKSYIDFSTTERDAIGRILYAHPDASLTQGMHFFADYNGNSNEANLFIDPDGNVGIGTTSPSAKLEINSGTNDANLRLVSTDPYVDIKMSDDTTTDDGVRISNKGDDLLLQRTGGNVGIGTASPGARLTIAQPGTTIGGNDISKGCLLAGSTVEGIGIDNNEIIKKGPLSTSTFVIGNANSEGAIHLKTNLQDRLVIENSGASITGTLTTSSAITINNSNPVLILRDTNGGDVDTQSGFISYRDNSDTERGYVGFGSSGNKDFSVTNRIGDINLSTKSGGKVYVPTSLRLGNGVTLAESSDRADMLKIQGITSGYAGVVISNTNGEDLWSLMADGDRWGVYNDSTNEWHIQCNDNGAVDLFYNSVEKLNTSSSGISINGNIDQVTDIYLQDQIIHHGDTDTYMQFHAGNQWRVVAGGHEIIECQNSAFNVAKNTSLAGSLTVAENSSFSKNLTVEGSLTVNGTVFTLNTTTVTVDDKNIELGSVASPTNDTANGGGITLKGATDKTISWQKSTASWDISENLGVADGKYIFTDKVRARDAAGLLLQDDSGNGITIIDGGNVSTSSDFAVGNNLLVPGTTSLVGNVLTTNNLTVGGTSYFSDSVTVAPNKTLFAKGGLSVAGTSTFNDNVTIADNKYITTDKIVARDAAGLLLQDDGGNGITINNGGNTSVSHAFLVGGNTTIGGNTSIVGTTYHGGAATFNDNLTINSSKTLQAGNITVADNKYITTDKIVARDSAGLLLQDDGGNGITIANGGNVSTSNNLTVAGASTFNNNVTIASNKTLNVGGDVNIGGETTFEGATVFEQNVVISGDFNVTSQTPMTLEQGQLEIQTLTSAPQNTTNQLYNLNSNIYWNGTNLATSHPNISAASSSNNSGRTYIQDITVDGNGHVTNIATATETVTNTNTTYSAGDHLDLNSTTFSVKRDLRGSNNGVSNGVYVIGSNFDDYFMVHGVTTNYADWYQGGDLRMRLQSPVLTAGSADLHVEGDVLAFSTTVSDKNFKDNINTIDNALYKVNKLRGVEFEWNATSRKGEKDIGVVAQEVEEVLPQIVREKTPCVGEFCENTEKYKTVDYQKLTAVLIEAVKELSAEVEDLKKKLS
jgi:hypothetical protein